MSQIIPPPPDPATPEEQLQRIEQTIMLARQQAQGAAGHSDRALEMLARYRELLKETRPES
jgi:hypothetical protein